MEKKYIPFLRWAGGKRWLVNNYAHFFPQKYNKYIDPFLGGGSVYFFLSPEKAILSDYNKELITTYNAIKDEPLKMLQAYKRHVKKHSKEYYYLIREKQPKSQAEISARFLYLNRTCFNGIYRVNSQNKFNVPFGEKYKMFFETDDFLGISDYLKNAEILYSDFEETIEQAEKGDFVFADPPYTVTHNNNGFVHYNEKLFSWEDQIRLAKKLIEAKKRGALVLATNANHEKIRELYEENFDLIEVSRYTSISGLSKNRKSYSELVIKSY